MTTDLAERPAGRRRGYLNPDVVHSIAFWIVVSCLGMAVFASLLAVWEFARSDVFWKAVSTCAIVGGGTLGFARVNAMFGDD